MDEFSRLFLHPSTFFIKHSRSAKIINGALIFKNIIFQKALQRHKNLYFHIIFYEIHMCFLLQINEGNSNYCDI